MDVELHCASYYSFMHGTSSPEQIALAAASQGVQAVALTDRHGFYGVPEFIRACQQVGVKPIVGIEIDGLLHPEIGLLSSTSPTGGHAERDRWLVICRSNIGYQQLARWITKAHEGRPKGEPLWVWQHMQQLPLDQLTLLVGCKGSLLARLIDQGDHQAASRLLQTMRLRWSGDIRVELNNHHEQGDDIRCHHLRALARSQGVPIIIAGQVRYLDSQQGPLFDVLQAIEQRKTLKEAQLPTNHQAFLHSPAQLQVKWKGFEQEVAATALFADQCSITFGPTAARLPDFPTNPGDTQDELLTRLCLQAFPHRYDEQHLPRLTAELQLIKDMGLSGYFLIVWDIVQFARASSIPVQGRGSAANSMVAYLLGITAVDPIRHNLFLGRFLHQGMATLPDIDLDFSSDRDHHLPCREQVIQYVYDRYGAEHVAMVATFITFQERSAIREVGGVLEMPPHILEKLVRLSGHRRLHEALEELSKDPSIAQWLHSPIGTTTIALIQQIIGLPRHTGIHVGGMLISSVPLSHVVPLEPARMAGRVVCQWDKYQIEDAGLIKVDLLGLGMLGVIREACQHVHLNPDTIPVDDPNVYDMLGAADTIGLFQVESRAQMQSLPQTQPRNLSELAIQISLIRPGPLQGNMVSPYIRRKRGEEPVSYFHPLAKPFLEETLGVVLYQEQVLQVAMAIAGFSAEQADDLRRSISRTRSPEALNTLKASFIAGALHNGVSPDVAAQVFASLEGFAIYGFCKSHALSFALLSIQSAYLKYYHPAAFLVAMLNHQPMGFYTPEILIQDAVRRGVQVLPIDIEYSDALCALQNGAVRLGLSLVKGWNHQLYAPLMHQVRTKAPFCSFAHFISCCTLPCAQIEALVHAGAFDRFGPRRALLWQLWHSVRLKLDQPDLFGVPDAPQQLPRACSSALREQECFAAGVSLREHPLTETRRRLGLSGSSLLSQLQQGSTITLIGRVVSRQKPPTAKGYAFMTLDDDEGLWNVVVRPEVYAANRQSFRLSRYLKVEGIVQRRRQVTNLLANTISSLSI